MTAHNYGRVSPFGHPRINALLATPRGLSRPYTSFIGLLCQGIHRVPLTKTHNKHMVTYKKYYSTIRCNHTRITPQQLQIKEDTRVHYTVLKQHETHKHQPPQAATIHAFPTGKTTKAIPDTQQCNKPSTKSKSLIHTHSHERVQHDV